jgi:hypothetical protein
MNVGGGREREGIEEGTSIWFPRHTPGVLTGRIYYHIRPQPRFPYPKSGKPQRLNSGTM